MNIRLISEEMIKPSLPTPPHLRSLKLSLLDQRSPSIYNSIILFYQAAEREQSVDQQFGKSFQLKKSLAKTLNHFYPLAGTIRGNSSIECNDEGVQYFEACVACQLSNIVETSDGNLLIQFLPFEPFRNSIESGREVVLAVKYTIFDCGGAAIGVCISHKIADGTSVSMFLKAWAAMSRGTAEVVVPRFDVATFFPPDETLSYVPNAGITKEKIVSRRFVFDKSSIIALKEKASSAIDSPVKDPTRVEAVSAFIWRRLIAISQSKPEPPKVFVAAYTVGLRDRMVPPLLTHSFGNLWLTAVAPYSMVEERTDERMLVGQLRNAIRKIDGDYIKKLQNDTSDYSQSILNYQKGLIENKIEFSVFTSWCRFPIYEVDFGWGKPTWACTPCRPRNNLAVLMSAGHGEGIEAWLNLFEEDMAILQRDTEFLSFISSNKEKNK